ncbi:hypothetical protein [Nocardia farcinica]|uniref:hypothetical protein n=2 Tax=Nocardia farcinica TaxID=37329 RepID=UPI0009708A92|nr:hypothetical protein [Nocardia farcinica]AXK87767.1 hypothetical protein DXT66_20990 [Nocardia farcinica]MBF6069390.1 hypothetical protein [Nocardia farcinica]MBF6295081.1 hypothetical protein [Nocardia farcinica]MBF6375473.1 hypothetical protein [Nocardia farcinica]MBF6381490.1 hypothetical protein [Nocardia farcinica]
MRKWFLTVGVAGVLVFGTGCSVTQSTPSAPGVTATSAGAPSMTQVQLCETLVSFFRDELRVVDVSWSSSRGPEADVSSGGVCVVLLGEDKTAGWQARRVPNDPDPTEGAEGFVETTEFGHSVWIQRYPDDPVMSARFATRVGDWNAQVRVPQAGVRTTDGILVLDGERTRKIAEFLVDLTRKLSTLPE